MDVIPILAIPMSAPPRRSFHLPTPVLPFATAGGDDAGCQEEIIECTKGSRVQVQGRGEMIMLCSSSYLGLLHHPRIDAAALVAVQRHGTSVHGMRPQSGTSPLHVELERALASFKQSPDAVVFPGGCMAGVAAVTALVGFHDWVFTDKLHQPGLVAGCELSGATMRRFPRNDPAALCHLLGGAPEQANKLVICEAVSSVEGDLMRLPDLSAVCREHGALLMVDESHAIGVLGATGRGIEEHFGLPPDTIDVKVGSLDSAVSSHGGYVAGGRDVVRLLRRHRRGFAQSATLPPPCAAAALAALEVMRDEPWRLRKLWENIRRFHERLRAHGLDTAKSESAIVSLAVGDEEQAARVIHQCLERGLFVQHPAPQGCPVRLRFTVTAAHSLKEMDRCGDIIADAEGSTRTNGVAGDAAEFGATRAA